MESKSRQSSRCLLCRVDNPEKFIKTTRSNNEFEEEINKTYNVWARSCIESVSRVLKISNGHPFKHFFLSGSYCVDCIQLLRDINFTLKQLDNLLMQIIGFRQDLIAKISNNYDQILDKHLIKTTYSDIEQSKNPKFKFSYDEVVKMVYEKIGDNEEEWTDLDFFSPTQTLTYNRIRNILDLQDCLDPNSEQQNPIHDDGEACQITSDRKAKKVINYYEQEDSENELETVEIKTEIVQIDKELNSDPDWDWSDTESVTQDGQKTMDKKQKTSSRKRGHPHKNQIEVEVANKFQCPDSACNREFNRENLLAIHQRKVHQADPKPYHCELCEKKFASYAGLASHIIKHKSGDQSVPCSDCGKYYTSEFYLKQHRDRMHSKTSKKCSFCGVEFENDETLLEHERVHKESDQPFKCTVCNAPFTNTTDLKQHMMSHNDKLYKCDTCGKQLSTARILRIHKKIHDASYVGHKCSVCSRVFQSKGLLNRHLISHSDAKTFICEVCGAAFKYDSGLKLHSRRHSGHYPFVCKICGKGFIGSHHLKHHEEIHSGTLSYECKVCKKRFRTLSNFQQHTKIHEPKDLNAKKRIRTQKPTSSAESISKTIETNSEAITGNAPLSL